MTDLYLPALLRRGRLVAAVVTTTSTCRHARSAHSLSSTSTIALGRLLTASALAGLIQERPGDLSLQVVGQGRLGQVYADVTADGALRGYVKNAALALPLFPDEQQGGRRSIAVGIGPGTLAVMRMGAGREYAHSTTELTSGEIDLDVERHLSRSDQIPTALACDVLLDERNEVAHAGGIVIQCLPDGDTTLLADLQTRLRAGDLAPALTRAQGDAEALLKLLLPEAEPVPGARELAWRCRCSNERVVRALKSLDVAELADMVDKQEAPVLDCHFCGKRYEVPAEEVRGIYQERLGANLS
jgi:molecular chaperone Hsp33